MFITNTCIDVKGGEQRNMFGIESLNIERKGIFFVCIDN